MLLLGSTHLPALLLNGYEQLVDFVLSYVVQFLLQLFFYDIMKLHA